MILFREKRCLALTWDQAHTFTGVLAERRGEKVVIQKTWRETTGEAESAAAVLARGMQALGGGGDCLLLLGGDSSKACIRELVLPKMKAADLAGALEFELPKYCPLPLDQVQWGYRLCGDSHDDTQKVRLIFFRRGDWDSWVDAASGFSRGVDMIMPAAGVLDPVLEGRDVCVDPSGTGGYFVFTAGHGAGREIVYSQSAMPHSKAFGLGPNPMEADGLGLGALGELEADEQRDFTSAVLLAMYGLSSGFYQDKKHWLGVPASIRPKRNRLLKVYTSLLVIYLIAVTAFLVTRSMYRTGQELQALDQQIAQLQSLVAERQPAPAAAEQMEALDIALREAMLSRHSVTDALMEMTTALDSNIWLNRFAWDDGELSVTLTGKTDSPDHLQALSESELFTNFRQIKKELRSDGSVLIQLGLTVRDQMALSRAPALPSDEPIAEPADDASSQEGEAPLPPDEEAAEPADTDALEEPPAEATGQGELEMPGEAEEPGVADELGKRPAAEPEPEEPVPVGEAEVTD